MEQHFLSICSTNEKLQELDDFMDIYEFYRVIYCPKAPNRQWKPRNERICRFCRKKQPAVSFRSNAHFLPEFLGNKYLIYQEECDQCNARFCSYESHFHAYLGITLTIFSTVGKKNKVPKFKAHGSDLTAQQEKFYGIDAIVIENADQPVVKMNMETGMSELRFKKQGYVPLKAYKCLLKIAATSLMDKDMIDYGYLLAFLSGEELDEPLSDLAFVKEYWVPVERKSPRVYLFRTKKYEKEYPTHICMVYFGYQAFEYIIPGNRNDDYMKGGVTVTPIFCPPFFDFPVGDGRTYQNMVSFAGREKITNEENIFHFQSNPEDLKNLTAYDPVTKKQVPKEFKPDEIVKLIFGRTSDKLDLPIDPD